MKRVLFVFLGMFLIGMVLFFAIDWYSPIANPEAWGRAWGRLTALLVIATAVYEVGRYIVRTGRPSKDPPLPWAPTTPPAPSGHRAPSEPPAAPACSGGHERRAGLACTTAGMNRKEAAL